MTQRTAHYALGGGLDLVTPPIQVAPGMAIAGVNYEPADPGYRRVDGYERTDGRPAPSKASYWVLRFALGDTEVKAAQTATGGTSGATGIVLFDGVVESGSYGGGDAAGFLVLAEVTGTFADGEDLEVSSAKVAEADGTAVERGAVDDAGDKLFSRRAIERRRDLIDRVPGHGDLRGLWMLNGEIFALRDHHSSPISDTVNVAATADDATEETDTGSMTTSGDLLGLQNDRLVGLRFAVAIGNGHKVFSAKVQFAATLSLSDDVAIDIHGESIGDAAAFTTTDNDISSRTRTTATVRWRPRPWLANAAGGAEQTPDLAPIINEIVGHSGWSSGNNLVLIFSSPTTGGPARQAASFDHATLAAPQLQIEHAAAVDEARLWQATSSGWQAQDLGNVLAFDAGTAAFAEGETVTGGTSGASATILRVVVEGGDWSSNDAAGRLILGTVTGGPFQNNETVTSASGSATADGADAAQAIAPGGRYDATEHVFTGSSSARRSYLAGGVDRAFEWDGATFVPLHTGLSAALDKPTRVTVHRNHLFLAYAGGSIQNSATGNPYNWEVVNGAGEIGLGDEVSGLLSTLTVMPVFGEKKISILYGDDANNFELRQLTDDAGAAPWSVALTDAPLYLDARGIRSLAASETFGDFIRGTITRLVEPLMRRLIKTRTPRAALRVRAKDQYRLFWANGTGLVVSFLRERPEVMPFDLGRAPTVTHAGEDNDDRDRLFFGDTEGWVFELDSGTSFDGEPVGAFVRLAFNHLGYPTRNKRWHKATLELDAGPDAMIGVVPEFSYADPDLPAARELSFEVRGQGGFWDEANWDEFYWSSPVYGLAEAHIDGVGKSLSLAIVSEATHEEPHTVHGVTLHYSFRRLVR